MNISVFILYAIPAVFIAWIGYEIPTWSMEDKFKYLIYSLCVLITFVFKYYADYLFKSGERNKREEDSKLRDEKISSLESQINDLEFKIRIRELEHAEAYQNIETKLSSHLKKNSKCKENENLWSGVQIVSDEVILLVKDSMNESKKIHKPKRTNRK